jgi:hypothetical protein
MVDNRTTIHCQSSNFNNKNKTYNNNNNNNKNTKMIRMEADETQVPGLWHVQKSGGYQPVNIIPILPILISSIPTANKMYRCASSQMNTEMTTT